MTAPTIADMLAVGGCFACLPSGTQQLVKLGLLSQILKALNPVATINVATLLSEASCLACIPAGQQGLVELALLSEILQAGSIGTSACLTCGAGPPVNSPSSPCCIFFSNVSTAPDYGSFYFWDVDNAQWAAFVVGQ